MKTSKIIFGDKEINGFKQSQYNVNPNDYKTNFLEWEFNSSAGHDVEIKNSKLIIKKFLPNEWIVRSNEILPAATNATMCESITNYAYGWEIYFKNIQRYTNIFSTHKESRNRWDPNDSCNMKGVGIYPLRVSDNLWLQQVSAVWEHLGHDGGFRKDGNVYNTYGFHKVADNTKALVLESQYTSLSNTWTDNNGLRYAIAIWTGYGNRIHGEDWMPANGCVKINDYKCIVTTRQYAKFLYSNNTSGQLTIKVSGMQEGDKIYYGNTTQWNTSLPTLLSDGTLTISPFNNGGFYLINDMDSTINTEVVIEFIQDKTWTLNNGADVVTMTNNIIDISANPIEIEIPNFKGIDVSTVENWKSYVGETLVYNKPKTVESCWLKYGYAKYNDNGILEVGNFVSEPICDTIKLPIVSDWENYIQTDDSCIIWRTQLRDKSPYNVFRQWYKDNIITRETLSKNPFAYSNFDGEITLNLDVKHSDGKPEHFLFNVDTFYNTSIEKVHIHSLNDCRFSAGQNFFRGAGQLKEITFQNDKGDYIFGATDHSGMFEYCGQLKTYPNKLINWGRRFNPDATLYNTHIPYMFEYTGLEVIPSYDESNRFADENTCVVGPFAAQMFNGSTALKKIGPVLDMVLVEPKGGKTASMFNCVALEDCRIKNLNHASWALDGTTPSGGDWVGNLANLNKESIEYLFDNLMDLGTYDPSKQQATIYNSFINWNSVYKNVNTDETLDWTTYVRYDHFVTRKRFSDPSIATPILSTNQDFGVNNEMTITVSGLKEGDTLIFGSGELIERTAINIVRDGEFTLTKNNTDLYVFRLCSTNVEDTSMVTVKVLNGYDTTNPKSNAANLYCPGEWGGPKFTSTTGWNITTSNGNTATTNATVNHTKRNYITSNAETSAYTTKSFKNLKFEISGLTEYDTLAWGNNVPLSAQTYIYNTDGIYTIENFNPNNENWGIRLYNATPYDDAKEVSLATDKKISDGGVESVATGYTLTDYIEVNACTSITWLNANLNGASRLCEFDENKNFIDYWSPNSNPRTIKLTGGANTKYIRFSMPTNQVDNVYLIDNTNKTYLYRGKNVSLGTYANTTLNGVKVTLLDEDYYTNKITDDMIASANTKNWTIYIGGVKKTIS